MNQIEAKVIKASVNAYTGQEIVTFELDYPRFIHAEIMTHRMFSRNAQSSRAVPVSKTLEVNQEWVKPVQWGKNKSGMSAGEELDGVSLESAKALWDCAAKEAFVFSKRLADVGLHKQWSNRLTEPFSRIKVVVTATEWDNFFWLRDDPDAAQPEIVELARKMQTAYTDADFIALHADQWHLPYIETRTTLNEQQYFDSDGRVLSLEDALKISASCCAQVSYRKLDDSKEKAIEIFNRLFSGPKPHLSPVEHQAMCFDGDWFGSGADWIEGLTHQDRHGNYWSGNFKDFIQYRQCIDQNVQFHED
jgi:hypothetical protein